MFTIDRSNPNKSWAVSVTNPHKSGFASLTLKDLVCGFDSDICFQITHFVDSICKKKNPKNVESSRFTSIRKDSSTNPATLVIIILTNHFFLSFQSCIFQPLLLSAQFEWPELHLDFLLHYLLPMLSSNYIKVDAQPHIESTLVSMTKSLLEHIQI